MALLDIIPSFAAEACVTAQLATVTSSAAIDCTAYRFILFCANTNMNIKFGTSSVAAAAATDFLIPANTIVKLQVAKNNSFIRIFNPTGGNGNYFIQSLFVQA